MQRLIYRNDVHKNIYHYDLIVGCFDSILGLEVRRSGLEVQSMWSTRIRFFFFFFEGFEVFQIKFS